MSHVFSLLPFIAGVVCLALIVFGRSYKKHLELHPSIGSTGGHIYFWPIVGLVITTASQYLLYTSAPTQLLFTIIPDGIALYAAYIQICRDGDY